MPSKLYMDQIGAIGIDTQSLSASDTITTNNLGVTSTLTYPSGTMTVQGNLHTTGNLEVDGDHTSMTGYANNIIYPPAFMGTYTYSVISTEVAYPFRIGIPTIPGSMNAVTYMVSADISAVNSAGDSAAGMSVQFALFIDDSGTFINNPTPTVTYNESYNIAIPPTISVTGTGTDTASLNAVMSVGYTYLSKVTVTISNT